LTKNLLAQVISQGSEITVKRTFQQTVPFGMPIVIRILIRQYQ
jgi:hypothetical protein